MFYYNHMGISSVLRPDRFLAVFLTVVALQTWFRGLFDPFRFGILEWSALIFTGLCFFSLIVAGSNRQEGLGANTEINEVFNLTVYPYMTYFLARQIRYSRKRLLWFLGGMVMIGVYLGVTAIFERFGINSLIFPSYISDMGIGIHQGRSRGPFLQSVFLGYTLVVCIACILVLVSATGQRWKRVLLLSVCFADILGVYFTNTRGAWVALGLVLAFTSFANSTLRKFSIGINVAIAFGFVFSGASQFSLTGGSLFSKRQNTIEQRDLNYRIAFYMGIDHPISGVGFSRMGYEFDKYFVKYYRGEEWQGWDGNHNEYLGLFAEVGIFAPLLFAGVLFMIGKHAYWGYRNYPQEMSLERALSVATIGALAGFSQISYFNQVRAAPFHICIIFLLAGLAGSARNWAIRQHSKARA